MPMISRNAQGTLLSVLGVAGGAITLFGNIGTLIQMTDFAQWVVSHWREWLTWLWTTFFSWFGIRIHPFLIVPLSTVVFFVQLAIGSRLTQLATSLVPGDWSFCGNYAACTESETALVAWATKRDAWVGDELERIKTELESTGKRYDRGAETIKLLPKYAVPRPKQRNCGCLSTLSALGGAKEGRHSASASDIADLRVVQKWTTELSSRHILLFASYSVILLCASFASTSNSLYGSFLMDFGVVLIIFAFTLYAASLYLESVADHVQEYRALIYRVYDRVILSVACLFALLGMNEVAKLISPVVAA